MTNCNVFPLFSDVSRHHTVTFRSQIHDEKLEEKVFGEVENRFVRLFIILSVWSLISQLRVSANCSSRPHDDMAVLLAAKFKNIENKPLFP